MEELLLQIVRESQNAKLSNLRKSAQDAYGESQSALYLIIIIIIIFLSNSIDCIDFIAETPLSHSFYVQFFFFSFFYADEKSFVMNV